MNDTDRFRRVEEVFNAALDAPEEERPAVLAQLCGDDLALRAEAETLVAAADGAAVQIREAIGNEARCAAKVSPAPRRIGPYRLVRELGHGGMGAVYLAVRDDDEYRNEVAIKLLHQGLETAEAIARFRDERQILASLDHPGIVRLLDGGRTEESLPYLVMEHVEGTRITEWADAHDLDVRGRVELFQKVCSAVAFAHQKLVVHRDLKPSNILVTEGGTPKLLDFGIAKLLDPGAGREAHTGTGDRLLTLEYASPEQLRGEPVATSTDVYALGAILYELLTGVPAQPLVGQGVAALRALLEKDPERPSLTAPPARRRALAGDLDNIVMKALQKDAARRYASVEQLSDDLSRHLDGLPVLARAGTFMYRAGKLLRRSRGLVAAIAVVLLSSSTATVVSVRQARRADAAARRADEQARRAQKRYEEVRSLANSLLFEVDGKIQSLEGATEAREVIVRRALQYLDGLAADAVDDPNLSRELAAGYAKIGEIQGNPLMPNLGRPRDGLESCAKAVKILDGLGPAERAAPATRWVRVRALFAMAAMQWNINESKVAARESIEAAFAVVATLPEDATFEYRTVGRGYAILHDIATADGDVRLAAERSRTFLELMTRGARADSSADAQYWIGTARETNGAASVLVGDPDGAARQFRESAAIFGALSTAQPENAPHRRELWFSRSFLAMCLSGFGDAKIWMPNLGDLKAAEEEAAAATTLAERQVKGDPQDARAVADLAYSLDQLGAIVAERNASLALSFFRRGRAAIAGLPPASRDSHYTRQFEWLGQCAMAVPLAQLGHRAEATAATSTGLAIAEKDAAAVAVSLDLRLRPPMCRYLAAKATHAVGDDTSADQHLREATAELRRIVATRPAMIVPYTGLVESLMLEATLHADHRCAALDEAEATWRGLPVETTPFIRRRAEAIALARAGCR